MNGDMSPPRPETVRDRIPFVVRAPHHAAGRQTALEAGLPREVSPRRRATPAPVRGIHGALGDSIRWPPIGSARPRCREIVREHDDERRLILVLGDGTEIVASRTASRRLRELIA